MLYSPNEYNSNIIYVNDYIIDIKNLVYKNYILYYNKKTIKYTLFKNLFLESLEIPINENNKENILKDFEQYVNYFTITKNYNIQKKIGLKLSNLIIRNLWLKNKEIFSDLLEFIKTSSDELKIFILIISNISNLEKKQNIFSFNLKNEFTLLDYILDYYN